MTTKQVDLLNIGLMLISAALAYLMPSELFLFAYAFLGPLHYLTEISWLHDRNYFTTGKRDYVFLCLPVIPLTLMTIGLFHHIPRFDYILLALCFGSAIGMTFIREGFKKILLGVVVLLCAVGLINVSPLVTLITVLLPTIIHVYVFTGFFILFGALKSKSVTGYLSLTFFLFCPAILLSSGNWALPFNTSGSTASDLYFGRLFTTLQEMFGLQNGKENLLAVIRFVAFAYTYHYLNWFSKTKIIGWHEISRDRLIIITFFYLLSISIYLYNYAAGFAALFFLSLLHVVLEFPLNHRSFVGVLSEVRNRLKS